MGLIGCVFPALSRDATLTLLGPELFVARPALWLRALSRYRATISPAPNFAYGLCVTPRPRRRDGGRRPLRLADGAQRRRAGGALGAARLRRPLRAAGASGREALTPVYGLSEAALAVTFSELGRPFRGRRFDREGLSRDGVARESRATAREIVSVGRPVPGFRLRIVDEPGRDLADGAGGAGLGAGAVADGRLPRRSGGHRPRAARAAGSTPATSASSSDGELYLTGRAKDVVILRGRNHAPEEIERAVDGVAGVRSGCVVAASWLPEDAAGEVLALFVEASRAAAPAERAGSARGLPRGGPRRHRPRRRPRRGAGAGHPPAHLLRQAAPGRDAAPLPRRGAEGARAGHPAPPRRRDGALQPGLREDAAARGGRE